MPVLTFNDGKNDENYCFYLSGNEVPNTQIVKDLGLVTAGDLCFDECCLRTIKNLFRLINFTFKSFETRNVELLLKLYNEQPLII